jgi:predicted metal-dependent hydrolase
MTSITVRRPEFEWPADLPLIADPDNPQQSCEIVGLSFTLPYLEPYLIRTMRVAMKEVDDDDLRADMKAFSGQEAQHFKNHAAINNIVRVQLSDEAGTAMRDLEDRLEADYRRFTAEKSLAFNMAYAEGFEAMTFAFARSSMSPGARDGTVSKWTELMAWHLAEAIEHRTVTFDAYEQIVGRYPYRVAVGTRAQVHYLGYLLAMAAVVYRDGVDPDISNRRVKMQAAKRAWSIGSLQGTLRSMSPRYNPRRVEISDDVREVTDMFGIDLG